MLCSRSVFRCFKKLERWGNIVTGAAGPYFVGLAVILISLGTICFCECVPQISIWNRRSRNIQLTWLLQPSHFPSSQYQYAFSLHSTCWCTTSTWLRLSQVFWKILHENMAQVSFGQRKAIGRASRRRWQAGFGGHLEAWRSHLHHIQGAPNVSNWGQRYVFVQFGDTLLNKAYAIGFFFFSESPSLSNLQQVRFEVWPPLSSKLSLYLYWLASHCNHSVSFRPLIQNWR